MRAYKTVNDTYIEPISFTVPRRAETFQADIFPPAIGTKPACGAKEWLDGKTGIPAKLDLESIYEGSAPKEVSSDYKPQVIASPSPSKPSTPKEEPKKEEPKPVVATRGPPPSVSDQKSSISKMANKFQDDEEDEEDAGDDDASSFEEITRPDKKTFRAEPQPPATVTATPTQPRTAAFRTRQSAPIKAGPYPDSTPSSPAKASPVAATASSGTGVEATLEQIKQLIEGQTKVIAAQNDKITQLASEVEGLKRKIGSGSQDQNERIRQLELELEQARS